MQTDRLGSNGPAQEENDTASVFSLDNSITLSPPRTPAAAGDASLSPHESNMYVQNDRFHSPENSQQPAEIPFFKRNVVQRCISAAVLAPLVTLFIWQSPAFATATVCSFVTNVCSYEFAWLANRIQRRILTSLNAYDDLLIPPHRLPQPEQNEDLSYHSTRTNDSSGERRSRRSRLSHSSTVPPTNAGATGASAGRSYDQQNSNVCAEVDSDLGTLEDHVKRCAITPVANRFCYGHDWLAAGIVSGVICIISTVIFLETAKLVPDLRTTEFYESRWFYIITTSFVASLCACLTPDWHYAIISFAGNAVFTILTMHSTMCSINQVSCGDALEPAQVLLAGILLIIVFRAVTSVNGINTIVNTMLDIMGFTYIVGTLSVVVAFVDDDKRILYRKLLIALLFVVWASDTGAYVTGKLLACLKYSSYKPLAAHLSKNKDYEGTLGAIIFGIAAMIVASSLLDVPGAYWKKVVLTVLAVVVGRIGDLFESLLKRAAGVKDSGKLIPGHGGMLDRIDALMFAALVFARYYALVVASPNSS